jgi:hypothetical protein
VGVGLVMGAGTGGRVHAIVPAWRQRRRRGLDRPRPRPRPLPPKRLGPCPPLVVPHIERGQAAVEVRAGGGAAAAAWGWGPSNTNTPPTPTPGRVGVGVWVWLKGGGGVQGRPGFERWQGADPLPCQQTRTPHNT